MASSSSSFWYSTFSLALLFQGTLPLHWAPDSHTVTILKSCVNSDVIFPWLFVLDAGEEVVDIKWLYSPGGSTPNDMIATEGYGHFVPVLNYSPRLRHLGNGSLELSHVQLQDSGNYTIEVSTHKGGAYNVISHVISLVVGEAPSASSGHLVVEQSQHAVYNNVTGQLHVQLTCGRLVSRGLPPVDVVWTTGTGQEISSSSSDHAGTYSLLLPNPVKGGNYSCHLPPDAPATHCLQSDSPLRRGGNLVVDSFESRLTLLEGENALLKEENSRLKEVHSQDLNQTRDILQNENALLRQDLATQKDLLNSTQLELRNLDSRFQQCHCGNSSGRLVRVSFYAMKGNSETPNDGGHVKFIKVVTNEGNAYNSATGEFTVPVTGTYFFSLTAGPHDPNKYSYGYIMVDDIIMGFAFAGTLGSAGISRTDYGDNQGTANAVLHLRQGQRVWVQSWSHSYFEASLSMFSGFLLYPD